MSVHHLIAGAILSSQLELVAIFDKMLMLSSCGGEIKNWITNEKRVDDKPWEWVIWILLNCFWATTTQLMNIFYEIWMMIMMSVDNHYVFMWVIIYDGFKAIRVIWPPKLQWLIWEFNLVEVAPKMWNEPWPFLYLFCHLIMSSWGWLGLTRGLLSSTYIELLRLGGLPLRSPKGLLFFSRP